MNVGGKIAIAIIASKQLLNMNQKKGENKPL